MNCFFFLLLKFYLEKFIINKRKLRKLAYILIQKLKGYGIKDDLLKLVQSFLSERRQRVVFGDIVSRWMDVTNGIPQGSVLGPLMFAFFYK